VGFTALIRRVARPPVRALRGLYHRADSLLRPAAPWNGVHHPILSHFPPWTGEADGSFLYDFLGTRTDPRFRGHRPQPAGELQTRIPSPWPGYFELVFLLESVVEAAGASSYTAIELGAGYGPWLATAAKAMERIGGPPVHLVGVEMVRAHFEWMFEHLRNNGVDPGKQTLIHAAISDHEGEGSYPRDRDAEEEYGRHLRTGQTGAGLETVATVTLPSILRNLSRVDLLHLDVQGAELPVIRHSLDDLGHKVRRLIFATHSHGIHRKTRAMLQGAGWDSVYDFGLRSRARTEFGEIRFADGLQAWLNPRVCSSSDERPSCPSLQLPRACRTNPEQI